MKVIIAGSRDGWGAKQLESVIENADFPISMVVSGGARGVDKMGERWAEENGIPIERYPAEWDKHGKSAGYIRNGIMAENADALIALWHRASRGTGHMIDIALSKKIPVYVEVKPGTQSLTPRGKLIVTGHINV